MKQKFLEVLIPTYRRPQAAIGAIDSVLSSGDSRVGVFCHSNGVEPDLEAAAAQRPAMRYACFPENRGAVANFRKILTDSSAEYVLFLSDEDRIDPAYLAGFVEFLSRGCHGFVFCSVVESTGANYFSLAALQGETLSLEDLLVLFPIDPTYLSGYCFRRDLLTEEVISAAFEDNEANVYPHVMLRNAIVLSSRTSIGLFTPSMIIKGPEANTGGDSHAHLAPSASVVSAAQTRRSQSLNPRIYGEGARARQFYYLVPRLDPVFASVPRFHRAYAQLYVLSVWLKMTTDAHLHVDVTDAVASLKTVIRAHRSQESSERRIVRIYNCILSIRQHALRSALVKFMWNLSKSVKLVLFFQRFGVSQTVAFVKSKHG